MDGLSFATAKPGVESDPARADIACFIGFVARRAGDLRAERGKLRSALEKLGWLGPDLPASDRLIPQNVAPAGNSEGAFVRWLKHAGWQPGDGTGAGRPRRRVVPESQLFRELLGAWLPSTIVEWWNQGDYLTSTGAVPVVDLLELRDVPVRIDTWDVFDALFAWDVRPIRGSSGHCGTALGAAVQLSQGGRKCYVVRLGDPWPVLAPAEERRTVQSAYLPPLLAPSAVDRSSWRGISHLFAMPDVSFLCLPDLPDLFGVTPTGRVTVTPPTTPEIFVECSSREDLPSERNVRGIPAPRCDKDGFKGWADLVINVGLFLARCAREVQFVAAIPLPVDEIALQGQALVAQRIREAIDAQWTQAATIDTAFVQLAYSWLRTRSSATLPGGLEAPDGVLAGVLANSALTRGSWRSAIRQPVLGITGVEPVLDRAKLARDLALSSRSLPLTLRDRITVIGPAPGGFQLLSDVTTDEDESYRPANVNRLMNAIIRAARMTGETAVFENNGQALWARLRDSVAGLLAGLWADGALDGASAEEAYEIRCDRSTMTQADLDAGRVICRVSFTAASPIVHITVVFAMDEGGQISIASREALAASQPQAA